MLHVLVLRQQHRLRLIAELGSGAGLPSPEAPLARRLELSRLVAAALAAGGTAAQDWGQSVPALTRSLAGQMPEAVTVTVKDGAFR